MTAPDPQAVWVACEALRSDAAQWAQASDEMAAASTAATGLRLDKSHFGWAAEERGVVLGYNTVQALIAGLLTLADREFDKIVAALRETADAYEHQDQASANRLSKVD